MSAVLILENTTQARQGVTGHNARYVLMLGLVGALAATISLGLMFVP
jgi:hypothetical protein